MNDVALDSVPILLDVMERMTFMCGTMLDTKDIPEEIPGALEATLSFTGPMDGKVTLWVDPEIVEGASDLLGTDESDSLDTLGEILNVFVGQILTQLGDEFITFDLGIPEVRTTESAPWQKDCCETCKDAFIQIEDLPVIIRVCLAR